MYTEQKAQLVVKQIQLADRGASSTILNIITESNGGGRIIIIITNGARFASRASTGSFLVLISLF